MNHSFPFNENQTANHSFIFICFNIVYRITTARCVKIEKKKSEKSHKSIGIGYMYRHLTAFSLLYFSLH